MWDRYLATAGCRMTRARGVLTDKLSGLLIGSDPVIASIQPLRLARRLEQCRMRRSSLAFRKLSRPFAKMPMDASPAKLYLEIRGIV